MKVGSADVCNCEVLLVGGSSKTSIMMLKIMNFTRRDNVCSLRDDVLVAVDYIANM